jgi:L-fuculose-phosphate aldolase
MKKVVSAKDIEDLLRQGGDLSTLPADAIYTPSARDLLRDAQSPLTRKSPPVPAQSKPAHAAHPSIGPADDIQRLFQSPEIHELKLQICDIGRRLWSRAYVDGNGGNISIRIADNLVLCTPTLVSKGFMKPEDMCFVDMEGNQKAGTKKRTSEILMHLQMMQAQPKAKAVVHCHPPHATAFAVAGVRPPTCMIPELEVMVGEVPIAPYETPGTLIMGQHVAKLVENHNTILMANHGVVAWSHSVEDAYFKMEIIEAYCRTIVVASQLGSDLKTISPDKIRDLLKIKEKLGIPDRRMGLKECELCDNSDWRPGINCVVPATQSTEPVSDPKYEALVQQITDIIMAQLKN